jgi:hypothetical protein
MVKRNKMQDDLAKKEKDLESKLNKGESKFGEHLGEPRMNMKPIEFPPDFKKLQANLFEHAKEMRDRMHDMFEKMHNNSPFNHPINIGNPF